MRSPTLAFLGFGKPRGESQETDEEKARREAEEAKAKEASADDDDEEEDEEDEEAKAGESSEDREARLHRNALRAAGESRGRHLERERIAGIMNGVDPAKAEFALHTALTTDLPADKAKALVDKAPKGARAQFADAMAGGQGGPGFAPSLSGGAGKPSLSGRMEAELKRRGWKK